MFWGKRRQYIIKKDYQYRFIAAFSVVCIAGIAMAAAVMHQAVGAGLEQNMYRSHIPVTGTAQIVVPIAVKTALAFVLAGALVLGAILFYFARKTQLMVDGFKEGLEMLRAGRFDFEFGDEESGHYFPELEEAFNLMVSNNRGRLDRLKAVSDGLEGPLRTLTAAKSEGRDETAAAVEDLGLRARELANALGQFRL